MNVAKVIVDLSLDKAFDYNIPEKLAGHVHVGAQVHVPFGRSVRRGYVLNIVESSDFSQPLKDIHSLCERHTRIPEPLVKLGSWISEYYCCSQEHAVRSLLPRAVRSGKIKHKTLKLFSIADTETAEKFVIEHQENKRLQAQIQILKTLLHQQEVAQDELLSQAGVNSMSSVNTLLKKGLINEDKRVVRRDPFADVSIVPTIPMEPTPEQSKALIKIFEMLEDPGDKHTLLLYGVTNSGKTEVYLQAIAKAIELGKEAIVLVPEISLTPQTVRRFRARFGDMVSVLHSRLTEGERFDEWSKVNEGLVKIVVGARSALFAPFRNLGLIIVDEEHESSYKQSESPRYHARDVAVVRGQIEKAVVILGSATPSFESYTNAMNGKYELAELLKRVDNCVLPSVKVVDNRLGGAPEEGKSTFFSKILIEAVFDRLRKGEQTILFLNRRGFARQMMCEHCGFIAECPDCSVAYTYHKKRQSLSCHLCGDVVRAFARCPDCGAEDIRYSGVGTEKVEAMAQGIFKEARVVRMDSDTMRKTSSYEDALSKFKRGEVDILIGTQMIAKGLHFPNVTLVGILNADQGLAMPDFRACERTFQLLTQVAGRAGRGDVKGEVIVQTFNPNNDTIRCAVAQDFKRFYDYDMDVRSALTYPPNGHLIAIHFRSENLTLCSSFAAEFMERLRAYCHDEILVTEPEPAPIERIKGKYRYMIMLRGNKLKRLRQAIRREVLHGNIPKEVDIYVDVDAQSLL
jgi:primosomal protein N' (replication factor Y)